MTKLSKKNSQHSHLALVRHGESLWNALGRWTGWVDIPLSKKGKHEAKLAAQALRDIKFDLAITSDLSRSWQTLEIIVRELRISNIPIIKEPAWRERHYGIYTGRNKWEIKKLVGEVQFKKLRRGWDVPIPEGETLKDVFRRVVVHFEKNIKPHLLSGKNILIVAHGNTHRALIKHLEEISERIIEEVEIATGEVVIYRIDRKGKIVHKEKRVPK